jgi:hypothetical protein
MNAPVGGEPVPRRSLLPLLVALILAAAVGLTALVVAISRSPRPGPPSPTPSPVQAPTTDRPLIWFRTAEAPVSGSLSLRATDWQGRDLGGVSLLCTSSCGVKPSPDGQRLLVGEQSTDLQQVNADVVYDATGKPLAAIYGLGAQWADDSRHLCVLHGVAPAPTEPATSQANLELLDSSVVARRTVATVRAPANQLAAWRLLACSLTADRAVITYEAQGVRALRVVQISTGKSLVSRDDAPSAQNFPPVASLVVSSDGSAAIENLNQGTGVRRLDLESGTSTPLAQLSGHGAVIGLSWNGGLALTPVGIYDSGTGASVWQAPSPAYVEANGTQPLGDGVAVLVWDSGSPSSRQVIVRGAGAAVALPTSLGQLPPLP